MMHRYLEVTFRKGRPIAGYLYLPREVGAKAVRTVELSPGILVDYAAGGEPIGLEITAPTRVGLSEINAALQEIGLSAVAAEEVAPLNAA